MLVKILLLLVLVLTIVIPVGTYFIGESSRKRYKKTLALNLLTFFGILVLSQVIVFTDSVSAAEVATAGTLSTGLGYIAAALSTGMSCIGAGIAVASSASSALGALSEDQSILGKSLIFVGLAEGIALYGLIISFMIISSL